MKARQAKRDQEFDGPPRVTAVSVNLKLGVQGWGSISVRAVSAPHTGHGLPARRASNPARPCRRLPAGPYRDRWMRSGSRRSGIAAASRRHTPSLRSASRSSNKPASDDWVPPSKINCEFLAPDRWKVEGKQRIVGHGGCGGGLIREATRLNSGLLRESPASRHSRRKNFHADA